MEIPVSVPSEATPTVFGRSAAARSAILTILFFAALALRLVNLSKPPMEASATRQFFMALIARDYYFQAARDIEPWRKDVSASIMRNKEISEPRIMQYVASLGYRALGGEHLWLPRLLSVIFYLAGGAALYALPRPPPSG